MCYHFVYAFSFQHEKINHVDCKLSPDLESTKKKKNDSNSTPVTQRERGDLVVGL